MVDALLRWISAKWVQVAAWLLFAAGVCVLVPWLLIIGEPTKSFLRVDFVFIAVYGVAFCGALFALCGKTWLLLLPVVGVVADLVENVSTFIALDRAEPVLGFVGVAEVVKLCGFWLSLALVVIGAILAPIRCVKRRSADG